MIQVCSVFSQLLQLFSRGEFTRAVKKHSAERHAKGFTSLGAVRSDAVLPGGAVEVPAGGLHGLGQL